MNQHPLKKFITLERGEDSPVLIELLSIIIPSVTQTSSMLKKVRTIGKQAQVLTTKRVSRFRIVLSNSGGYNSGVICEEEAKKSNSGAKTKTFEENYYLLLYAVSSKEDTALQEEKALSLGETFNWQTATYSKMEYSEDEDNCFANFETKFPAIVLDNTLTSDAKISCGPTVSPLNDNEIDFRILFDESDDEDYTPEVSYFNDLYFFKDFENEFPSIVYNDALTSKFDLLTEPTISPRHTDEFDLKDETSLSECADIAKITRKQLKPGKHGHEERKSTQEAGDSKAKG
ncbi:hypothetical protein Tco_0031066 [Tanacetum coccineum]